MSSLACIHLPAFSLQLLLRRRREWTDYPAAVVAEDKPQALILRVNEKARRAGILPGLRYTAAVALAHDLRAAGVSPAEIESGVTELLRRLSRFSPQIEPASEEPGVFWLGVAGLNLLYSSLQEWAEAVHADLRAQGFCVRLAVGWTRFGTYAAAKERRGITVFADPAAEHAAALEVSLEALDLERDFRGTLHKLGIETVGAFLTLPPGGLSERFGPEAYRVYQMAAGELWTVLQPRAIKDPIRQKVLLDDPETDVTRLLFLIRRELHPMLSVLAARSEALAELGLAFLVEKSGWRKERIRPAAPTLDDVQMLDLVRLRLESVQFSAGVVEIELTAGAVPATCEQLQFFAQTRTRDLDAANRALARLRAEFGAQAVVRAKLADGHLPEARFAWEPLQRVEAPRPQAGAPRTLVRRILAKPAPLASDPRSHDDGWLLLGPKFGSVDRLSGPYIFSGGWWTRAIHREYYFAETRRGALLWIYYDRPRRRWFLQGWTE